MAQLSKEQLTMYAQRAGFSGNNLNTIVGIALAESGGNSDAFNGNDPSGGSFGVLQINGVHFGNGTSKSCALDPACAFQYAYKLSGGANFSPWSTYTSGLYKNYTGETTTQTNEQPWYTHTPIGDFGKQLAGFTYPVQGEDIPMPQDTPITALFAGTVSKQYYDGSGGTEIIKASDPTQTRNIPYYYFLHLDNFAPNLNVGSSVFPGDIVGYSGGQNTGGSHPAAPNFSSGPHLEIGLSKNNSIPYTLSTITPDLNPDWMLSYAQGANIPSGSNATLSYSTASANPLDTITNFLSSISALTDWLKDPKRIIKLVMGSALMLVALLLLFSPQIVEGVKTAVKVAETVAA